MVKAGKLYWIDLEPGELFWFDDETLGHDTFLWQVYQTSTGEKHHGLLTGSGACLLRTRADNPDFDDNAKTVVRYTDYVKRGNVTIKNGRTGRYEL